MVAGQQHDEEDPGGDGQHGLVGQVLGKEVIDVDKAGDDGQRQQDHPDPDQLEQHALHGLERRQHLDDAPQLVVLEPVLKQGQGQGLQGGQGQQAVGEDGQQHVGGHARAGSAQGNAGAGHQQSGGNDQRRQGEQTGQHGVQRTAQAGAQGDDADHPENQGGDPEKAQVDPLGGQDGGQGIDEIGRASCRERVEIAVGAGASSYKG